MYLEDAKGRARDDDQKRRTVLLESRIREKTRDHSAAINLLKSSLDDLSGERHQAAVWDRMAQLHWDAGEKFLSFIAPEVALQMEPLRKDRRFRLAYRYADSHNRSVILTVLTWRSF